MKLLAAILLVTLAGGGYAYYANSSAKAVEVTPASVGACCAHEVETVAASNCADECADACDVTACAPEECAPAGCGEASEGNGVVYAMVMGDAMSAVECDAAKAACSVAKSECDSAKSECESAKSECSAATACTADLD
jgi:hypothetical protein